MIRPSLVALFSLVPLLAQQTAPSTPANVRWHDMAKFNIEGKGWTATKRTYDRLPASAEGVVREPVWDLSQDSAGLRYRFITDADSIHARWKLHKSRLAMSHMAATGVSGLDLYVRAGDKWRWVAVGRPEQVTSESALVTGMKRDAREYLLYLPLYNGVDSVEIGIPEGATFSPAPERYQSMKHIVFYGTSIVQGGCAARPGMAYPSIIGRTLDVPVINLGFSGNGKMEPEMAKLLAQLDPSVYVLDALPNNNAAETAERLDPLVKALRVAHPSTPIVLVDNVMYTNGDFVETRRVKAMEVNALLKQEYDKLVKAGDKNVFYVSADKLLGADGEDTVDGTHPTDLGFLRMAEGITPVLQKALRRR